MYNLNNIGQSQSTDVGDFFRGLGTGLHGLIENKTKEIQRQKNIDKLQRIGFNPQAAELLNHIQEVDPAHFSSVLQSLGEGAYSQSQPGVQSLQPEAGIAESVIEKPKVLFKSNKEDVYDKEQRKLRDDFLKTHQKKLNAVEELGDLAENTLRYLEEHKDELPGFPLRLIEQKYNPLASSAVRKLDADYKKISGKVAAANAAGSGFRSGKALLDLAKESKSAIDQPYETQVELLKDLIKERDEEKAVSKKIQEVKKLSGGKYPIDLMDKIEAMESEESSIVNQESPLQNLQEKPKLGSVRIVNGQKQAWNPKNNAWVPANW